MKEKGICTRDKEKKKETNLKTITWIGLVSPKVIETNFGKNHFSRLDQKIKKTLRWS